MAGTQGIADLVGALTGGAGIENAAYDRQAARMLEAREKQAMLDKRMQEAALVADQMRSRGNFERNSMDMPPEVRFAIMAGMGSDFNQGMQGLGHQQSNAAQADAINVARNLQGVDPATLINALSGARKGTMIGSDNVRVGDQANAKIAENLAQAFQASTAGGENQAQTSEINARMPFVAPTAQAQMQDAIAKIGATNAQTQMRQAQAENYRAQGANDPTQGLNPSGLDQQIMNALYMTEEVPNPDYDPNARWFPGDPTVEQTKDYVPEFLVFQAEMAEKDPRYLNADYALAQFMRQRQGGVNPQRGTQGPGKNTRYLYDPTSGTIKPVGQQ